MRFRILIILSVFLFLISACGIFKKGAINTIVQNENETDSTKDEMFLLIDSINSNIFDYKTLQANFSGSYDDNSTHLPLKGVIRIKHETFIWISIRPAMAIEVSRIMITPDSIQIIDRLNNQYYSEGIHFIESKFKFKSDFHTIESILSGKLFFYPEFHSYEEYKKESIDTTNQFNINKRGISDDPESEHRMTFNMPQKQLIENFISFPGQNQRILFVYANYERYENKDYFTSLTINGETKNEKLDLKCDLSNIVFNMELTAPFKIPESYQRIKSK